MAAYEFFYDKQIRRFLLQVVRAFTGFQYQVTGRNGSPPELRQVPCRMASQNRQVGQIMRQNSENAMLTVPMITVWIKEMNIARDRTQAPGLVSSVQVSERKYDETLGEYTGVKGNSYTVERVMPHPLDLIIQVDIWTSNELQKHQLWEQIYMAFNVGFDIQSSENPADWTALTSMTMESMQWSSRSVPIGTADEIDVASFTFKLPIWITPPAKVKQQKLIHQIVTNFHQGSNLDESYDDVDGPSNHSVHSGDLVNQNVVTPNEAWIQITNGSILLKTERGEPLAWAPLLEKYGTMIPAESQLRLRAHLDQDLDLDIIGSIQFTNDPNVLQWTVDVDTLPSNTLSPVDAIIDPLKHFPNHSLPAPVGGQRYLIVNDIGPSKAWANGDNSQTISAKTGDIIQYVGNMWKVVFKASESTTTQFIVNLKSEKQLKFVDNAWIMAIDGEYNPGFWRIRLG